jgi:hypothetical protein
MAGLAYVGEACTGYRYSIVEERGGFASTRVNTYFDYHISFNKSHTATLEIPSNLVLFCREFQCGHFDTKIRSFGQKLVKK